MQNGDAEGSRRRLFESLRCPVELRAGAAAGAAAIIGFCRERLASYKVPARLEIRAAAAFPRTPTGKIHKPTLREELAAGNEP